MQLLETEKNTGESPYAKGLPHVSHHFSISTENFLSQITLIGISCRLLPLLIRMAFRIFLSFITSSKQALDA